MRRQLMTGSVVLIAAAALAAPAAAKVPGSNGRIVFDDHDEAIYTADPGGGDLTLINTSGDGYHFSGDGRWLTAAADNGDGRVGTQLMRADGSERFVPPIPDPTLQLACFAWEPGDARLACEAWDDGDPSFAPGVFQIDRTSWTGLRRLTTNPSGGHDIPGDYAPDGSALTFTREDPERGAAVFVLGLATSEVRRVGPWQEHLTFASWSPDGRRLLFDDSKGGLVTVRPDGSGRRPLTLSVPSFSYASYPAWSPDGSRIVFALYTRRRPNATEAQGIYTATARGTDVRLVARSESFGFSNPDWGAETP